MRAFALIALFASFAVQAAPASEASVEQLLTVSRAEALMDGIKANIEPMFNQTFEESMRGQPMTAQQKQWAQKFQTSVRALMQEELAWDKLKPQYIQIYRESFEQEEIDGMLAFYASPAGQAMINKMPVVMQKSMQLSQRMMQSMMGKMKTLVEETAKEAMEAMEAEEAKEAKEAQAGQAKK